MSMLCTHGQFGGHMVCRVGDFQRAAFDAFATAWIRYGFAVLGHSKRMKRIGLAGLAREEEV